MAPITTSTSVNRPAEDVFDYATDPTRFSEWQQGFVDGHLDDPVNPGVGTRCITIRRIGLANRPVTSELTHINPPKSWGVRGIDGPIRAVVDVTVEPLTDTRSRLTITINFAGSGIGKVLVPLLVQRQARKEMPANLARLNSTSRARASGIVDRGGGESRATVSVVRVGHGRACGRDIDSALAPGGPRERETVGTARPVCPEQAQCAGVDGAPQD